MKNAYTFSRELGDEIHTNPEVYNLDHQGEPTPLIIKLFEEFPDIEFHTHAHAADFIVEADRPLTESELERVGEIIEEHKTVVDWPLSP
jgi:hypothetical protein